MVNNRFTYKFNVFCQKTATLNQQLTAFQCTLLLTSLLCWFHSTPTQEDPNTQPKPNSTNCLFPAPAAPPTNVSSVSVPPLVLWYTVNSPQDDVGLIHFWSNEGILSDSFSSFDFVVLLIEVESSCCSSVVAYCFCCCGGAYALSYSPPYRINSAYRAFHYQINLKFDCGKFPWVIWITLKQEKCKGEGGEEQSWRNSLMHSPSACVAVCVYEMALLVYNLIPYVIACVWVKQIKRIPIYESRRRRFNMGSTLRHRWM